MALLGKLAWLCGVDLEVFKRIQRTPQWAELA